VPVKTSGGIMDAYRRSRTALAIPSEGEVRITIPAGTKSGAQFICQVYPEDEKALTITYFELTTPIGVEGNVVLKSEYGEVPLLELNQPESMSEFYDPSDFGVDCFYVTSFSLVAEVVKDLTTDAVITLKFGGGRRVA